MLGLLLWVLTNSEPNDLFVALCTRYNTGNKIDRQILHHLDNELLCPE